MTNGQCSVESCNNKIKVKFVALCSTHYRKYLKSGGSRLKPRGLSPKERLYSKVQSVGDCLIWVGALQSGGYGVMNSAGLEEHCKGATIYVHRASWILENGAIGKGLVIDHFLGCNRACINPSHLQAVSSKQNNENLTILQSNNSTGFRGVYKRKDTGKYGAQILHNYRRISDYPYDTAEEANVAAIALRNKYFSNNIGDHSTQPLRNGKK